MERAELLNTVFALGGVLLGIILAHVAAWIRETKSTRSMQISTRKLIELEVANNLSMLKEYWALVMNDQFTSEDHLRSINWKLLSNKIIDNTLPSIRSLAWSSNLDNVTIYYTDSELEKLWLLYHRLEDITDMYLHLDYISSKKTDEENARHLNLAKRFNNTMDFVLGFSIR